LLSPLWLLRLCFMAHRQRGTSGLAAVQHMLYAVQQGPSQEQFAALHQNS
jgi:hypothetical protein